MESEQKQVVKEVIEEKHYISIGRYICFPLRTFVLNSMVILLSIFVIGVLVGSKFL